MRGRIGSRLVLAALAVACGLPAGARGVAPGRTVVYLIVDGLRWDALWSVMQDARAGEVEALAEVFGRGLSRSAYFLDAHSTFPSVTFAANASLVTGVPPARHGIVGNSFFDRAAGQVRILDAPASALDYRKGLADSLLGAPTLYQQVGAQSVVSFHMYRSGAVWLPPRLTDAASYEGDPERYDLMATVRLLNYLQRLASESTPLPGVASLYWGGLDSLTHVRGTDAQPQYLRTSFDRNLRVLLNGLRRLPGGLDAFAFVLVADHGHTDHMRWIPGGEVSRAVEAALRSIPAFRRLGAERIRDHARVEVNGGMVHVYLRRPGEPWTRRLSEGRGGRELLEALGGALASDRRLSPKLDLVLAASGERGAYRICRGAGRGCEDAGRFFHAARQRSGAGDPYPGAEAALGWLAGAANAGNLLLTSSYDAGYAFLYDTLSEPHRSVHGSLRASDMRIPLVVAGDGVVPGPLHAPHGLLDAPRIVARMAGAPLPGLATPDVQAPSPGASRAGQDRVPGPADLAPEILSPARAWALGGETYRCRLVGRAQGGAAPTWRAVETPHGMSIDSAGTLTWEPTLEHLGAHRVSLKASDPAGRSSSLTFTIRVYLPSPRGLAGKLAGGAVALTWEAVRGARAYDILRFTEVAGAEEEFRTTGTRWEDPRPSAGHRVGYLVQAVDMHGRSGAQLEPIYVEVPAAASSHEAQPLR